MRDSKKVNHKACIINFFEQIYTEEGKINKNVKKPLE